MAKCFSHAVQRYRSQAASSQNITKDDISSDNIDVPGNKSCSRRLLPILILVVTDGKIQLSFSSYDRQERDEAKANTPNNRKKKNNTQHTEILRISFKSQCTHSGLIKIAHPTVCTIPEISRYYPTAACTTQNRTEACFSGAHPSVSPSLYQMLHFSPKHGTGGRSPPPWLADLCPADHKKVSLKLWHFALF